MEAFYFGFGDDDVFVTAELPDNAAAAALALAADVAGGIANLSTVVLITPEEVDEAAKSPDHVEAKAGGTSMASSSSDAAIPRDRSRVRSTLGASTPSLTRIDVGSGR